MTGSELAVREQAIDAVLDRSTGQVLTLREAPLNDLARWLENIREAEAAVREQKAAVSAEIHRRMDEQVTWTLRTEEGYKLSGQSPNPVTYDGAKLYTELEQLVAEDLIPRAAMDVAVEREYAYRVRVGGVAKLKKLGGAAAAAVDRCKVHLDPARRKVSISREGF